jgi:hypothetical protein
VALVRFLFSLLASFVLPVDYLPDARRPWVAHWKRGVGQGRGTSMVGAIMDHWKRIRWAKQKDLPYGNE